MVLVARSLPFGLPYHRRLRLALPLPLTGVSKRTASLKTNTKSFLHQPTAGLILDKGLPTGNGYT